MKTRVPESLLWTAGPRCAKGPGCSVGLEFCPGNEGSTVLEAQVRKGAVHLQPHSRRKGPDSGWECSTILGATGTDEHAGGFARRAAKIISPPPPPSWMLWSQSTFLAKIGSCWCTGRLGHSAFQFGNLLVRDTPLFQPGLQETTPRASLKLRLPLLSAEDGS